MKSTPPPYIIGSIPPPAYGTNAVYGIQVSVNELIMGAIPLSHHDSYYETNRLMDKIGRYKKKIKLPSAPSNAIKGLFCPRTDGWPPYQLMRMLGLVLLPGAIVSDIVKPPYYLAQIAVASSRSKRATKKAEDEVIDEITGSLHRSLEVVLEMLVRLGHKNRETWTRQIWYDDQYRFPTLARLLEAHGLRFAPPDTIYLASRTRLNREDCSGIARLHFDQIHNLKDDLISIGRLPGENIADASAAIEKWLPRVVQALKEPWVEENVNPSFYCVLQRLRSIRQELPALLSASSK
ncbi:hypothetical protein BJ875DRAFT_514420 [Amylocarpus encephaloides]|uniref:Uncharacterized protein n=1 Tax=Amylocarpus encephaloides TaxID=45428 RepID=A0A9P7YGB7_9HELO|nr:hypothetical protein BJ875DRAFT_514420 [Amylocarpus encephaloides]